MYSGFGFQYPPECDSFGPQPPIFTLASPPALGAGESKNTARSCLLGWGFRLSSSVASPPGRYPPALPPLHLLLLALEPKGDLCCGYCVQ